MEKKFDVSSICNILVDILINVEEKDLSHFALTKGEMHLIDNEQRLKLLDYFADHPKKVELGGSSLNTIKTLAQLGSHVSFTGMVGKDSYGETAQKKMRDTGIYPYVFEDVKEATGKCIVLITPDGQRTLNTYLGAGSLYEDSFVPYDSIKQSRIFHFCGYQWDTEQQRAVAKKAITVAKENSCLVSFDLADPYVVHKYKNDFLELLENDVDIFFANREESACLFDKTPIEKINPKITGLLKQDKDGAIIYKNGEQIKIDPIETKVKDTTGAGDIFAAGFLYGIISKQKITTCGEIASLLASDVISHLGAFISPHAISTAIKKIDQNM